jgi:hypothetical protein
MCQLAAHRKAPVSCTPEVHPWNSQSARPEQETCCTKHAQQMINEAQRRGSIPSGRCRPLRRTLSTNSVLSSDGCLCCRRHASKPRHVCRRPYAVQCIALPGNAACCPLPAERGGRWGSGLCADIPMPCRSSGYCGCSHRLWAAEHPPASISDAKTAGGAACMKSTQLCGCQAVTRAALHARLPKVDAVLRSECQSCSPSRCNHYPGY